MSLKKKLHEIIKGENGGIVTHHVIQRICEVEGRRVSNGERRLRPSESPDIETVYNKKGFIVGYRAKPQFEEVKGQKVFA